VAELGPRVAVHRLDAEVVEPDAVRSFSTAELDVLQVGNLEIDSSRRDRLASNHV